MSNNCLALNLQNQPSRKHLLKPNIRVLKLHRQHLNWQLYLHLFCMLFTAQTDQLFNKRHRHSRQAPQCQLMVLRSQRRKILSTRWSRDRTKGDRTPRTVVIKKIQSSSITIVCKLQKKIYRKKNKLFLMMLMSSVMNNNV
jgi:hypothetical protein